MAIKTEVLTIESRTYEVTQLPALRSLKLMARLGKVAGPAIAKGLDADVAAAAAALFERLGEDDVEHILRELFASTVVVADGKRIPMMTGFDERYADNLGEVFTVLRFALETIYGPTFAGLMAAAAARPEARAAETSGSISTTKA